MIFNMLSCIVFFKQNGCSKQNLGKKETGKYLSTVIVRFIEFKYTYLKVLLPK